jgi:hypothetical protein
MKKPYFEVFCVVFFVLFVLCRVHPMLPVSLDFPFLIASPVLSDAYFMYKNPISKEINDLLVVTLSILFYTITVGKKTVRLIHISVDLYTHLHMPIEGDSEY